VRAGHLAGNLGGL